MAEKTKTWVSTKISQDLFEKECDRVKVNFVTLFQI